MDGWLGRGGVIVAGGPAPVGVRLPVHRAGGCPQSALILGTAQLGGAYGIANRTGSPDAARTVDLLRTAAELGVTHVDTARAYGDSERRIGIALLDLPDCPLRVVTKVAPLTAGADRPDLARAQVAASLRDSLALLGARPELTVLLHRAGDAPAAWPVLREYLAAGTAVAIGVSVQSPAELAAALELPGLGYVQLPCNVLDGRWLDPALAAALARRPELVVAVRSVYLQGLLAAGTAVRWPVLADPDRDTLVAALDRTAADLGRADRPDLCVAYVRGLPWVSAVVIGAETPDQLRENAVRAARPPLDAAGRAAVRAALAAGPAVPAALLDPSRWPGCPS